MTLHSYIALLRKSAMDAHLVLPWVAKPIRHLDCCNAEEGKRQNDQVSAHSMISSIAAPASAPAAESQAPTDAQPGREMTTQTLIRDTLGQYRF